MTNTIKKRFLLILSILILIIVLWFSASLWLTKVGEFLILDEVPRKAEIIIVLSGDDEGRRLRHAFNLYRWGYSSKILLSGETNLWQETGIDLMERYLVQLGVPPVNILSEKLSESTVENAHYSRHLMEKRGLRSAIVVTSPTHTRRASIIFKRIFSSKITVSVSSDSKAFLTQEWWRDSKGRRAVIREYFQIAWYLLFGD